MRSYRTIQGDTWDLISWRVYGHENLMSVLISENEDYADYMKFPAGIILKVPEPEEKFPATLPPWKRD